ncbi:hypothetical protein Q3C01_39145 [Bradyrhizobium sp. UFLA05-109]
MGIAMASPSSISDPALRSLEPFPDRTPKSRLWISVLGVGLIGAAFIGFAVLLGYCLAKLNVDL